MYRKVSILLVYKHLKFEMFETKQKKSFKSPLKMV